VPWRLSDGLHARLEQTEQSWCPCRLRRRGAQDGAPFIYVSGPASTGWSTLLVVAGLTTSVGLQSLRV